jgi:hypothetical protein
LITGEGIRSASLGGIVTNIEGVGVAIEGLKPEKIGAINVAFEDVEAAVERAKIAVEQFGDSAALADQAMLNSAQLQMMRQNPFQYGNPSRKDYWQFLRDQEQAEMDAAYKAVLANLMENQRALQDAMHKSWAEFDSARRQGISDSWLDIFGGGEFDSDLIIGSIRNIGWAMIQTGGATEAQTDQIKDLTDQYERAKEKLWELNQGIGVQGDKTESVTKRIEDQAAEVANYERIIGELNQAVEAMPVSTERRWIGLNLDDVQIFKNFIELAGQSGSSAEELGQLGVAMNLFGQNTADAMSKVSLVDSFLKNLNLQLQAGQIDVSQVPGAISEAIALLEQDLPVQDILVQVRANVAQAQAEVNRELNLPEEDRTRELNIGANMSPAMAALAMTTGMIANTQEAFKIDADDEPARKVFDALKTDIENATATLDIQGVYHPPANMPDGGTASTTNTRPGGQPRGYAYIDPYTVEIAGSMPVSNSRPVGNAQLSLQNYFYAPIGGAAHAREIIVRAGDDAAEQLVQVLKRSGYTI